MARTIHIDEVAYQVYRAEEYLATGSPNVAPNGLPILIAQPCAICGDQLLGTPPTLSQARDGVTPPHCAPGQCGSRRGTHYI